MKGNGKYKLEEKFRIIPIAPQKTMKMMVKGKEHDTRREGKILGLKLQSNGMTSHCATVKNQGNAILTNLRRF